MNTCFADTFYFIALLNTDDRMHEPAVGFAAQALPLVTTTWVLTELADGLAATPWRTLFDDFLKRLRSNPSVSIVSIRDDLFERGVLLYVTRPDKQWSLTDCISFVVMREMNITDALTGDHHFEQAGFAALLK